MMASNNRQLMMPGALEAEAEAEADVKDEDEEMEDARAD